MNYCKRCIMPDTRPDQYQSSEGVCNACLSFDFQKKIDWNQRKSDLLKIISEKNLDKNKWNCIDHDGLMKGYDNELIQLASSLVNVPIIASGGAGNYEHFYEAYKNGADAFAAASIYHFTKHTPAEAKKYLVNKGVPIRENFII